MRDLFCSAFKTSSDVKKPAIDEDERDNDQSSQDHAKIMISYRPFRTRPILGWGIHSDRQKWAQNNISIPIGYLKGPERAFFCVFRDFLGLVVS